MPDHTTGLFHYATVEAGKFPAAHGPGFPKCGGESLMLEGDACLLEAKRWPSFLFSKGMVVSLLEEIV